MAHQFSPLSRSTMSEDISRMIIDMINAGKLTPGSKLPSERDLMEQLKVSRSPVREALRSLTLVGILETIPGDGTYVSKHLASDLIAGQFQWAVVLLSEDVLDLFEVREPLEIQAAGLAAKRATPDQLKKMRCLIDDYQNADNVEREAEVDVAIHDLIVEMSHNRILIQIMNTIRTIWHTYRKENLFHFRRTNDLEDEYFSIFRAIEAGDELQARMMMLEHISHSKLMAFVTKAVEQNQTAQKPEEVEGEE